MASEVSSKFRKTLHGAKPELYAFLLPFAVESIVVLGAYLIAHLTIASCDCFAQYMPFFTEFYDKITSGESLFYSWSGAFGYDFWSVFAYYLASPLNFIIFIFGRKGIAFSVNLLIILKTSLAGASFAHYAKRKFGTTGTFLPVLFGIMYSLSGYTMGYCFNVMWLDSVAIFPLVLLAMERMLYEKKPAGYCLLLACSLIFNYFIGFETCIFIFLYFFTCKFDSVKDFFKKLFRIAVCSAIAVGAAAIILFPSYMVLQSTAISGEAIPAFELLGDWGNTLYNMLFASYPAAISWTENRANLYVSILAVFMAVSYLVSPAFSVKEKLKNVFLLAVLFLSFNCALLNWVWHGFHAQNGIPNRFSFMAIFVIISMGYQAAKNRRKIHKYELIISGVICAAFIGFIFYLKQNMLEETLLTLILVILYFLISFSIRSSKNLAKFCLVPVLAELVVMLIITVTNITGMSIDGYFDYVDDMLAAGEITLEDDDGFYREKIDQSNNLTEYIVNDDYDFVDLDDITSWEQLKDMISNIRNVGHHSVLNEESLYSINAGSLFNTFTNSNVSDFVKRTGGLGSSNTILYRGENAFMDMLLGVKYYYARYHGANALCYEPLASSGGVTVYRNKNALSVGYAVPDKYAALENFYSSNPFRTMNKMSQAISGEDIYTAFSMELTGNAGCTVADSSSNYAKLTDTAFKSTVTYAYTMEKTENFQLYISCGDMYLTYIKVNGENIATDRKSRQVYDLGTLNKGDRITVTISLQQKSETSLNIYGASLDWDGFYSCYDTLSEQQLIVSQWDDNTIKGSVNIEKDNTKFFFSVPYSTGWNITVDGEKTQADKFSDTFIMLELDAGRHIIELDYVTPGFKTAAIVSGVCFFIILVLAIISKKRAGAMRKQPQTELLEGTEDVISDEEVPVEIFSRLPDMQQIAESESDGLNAGVAYASDEDYSSEYTAEREYKNEFEKYANEFLTGTDEVFLERDELEFSPDRLSDENEKSYHDKGHITGQKNYTDDEDSF